jgi:hypothetical protein
MWIMADFIPDIELANGSGLLPSVATTHGTNIILMDGYVYGN